MSDQTDPSVLRAMADKRILGKPGDNSAEAALRACAQQWDFDRQESNLRRIRAELAERRMEAVKAREEAEEGRIDGLLVFKAWHDEADRLLDSEGIPSEAHETVDGELATRLLPLPERMALLITRPHDFTKPQLAASEPPGEEGT